MVICVALTEVLKIVAEDKASEVIKGVSKNIGVAERGANHFGKALVGIGVSGAAAMIGLIRHAATVDNELAKITGSTTALGSAMTSLEYSGSNLAASLGHLLVNAIGGDRAIANLAASVERMSDATKQSNAVSFFKNLGDALDSVSGGPGGLGTGIGSAVADQVDELKLTRELKAQGKTYKEISSELKRQKQLVEERHAAAMKAAKEEEANTRHLFPVFEQPKTLEQKEAEAKAAAAKELAMEEKRDAAMQRLRDKFEAIDIKKTQLKISRDEEIFKFKQQQEQDRLAFALEIDARESAITQRRISQLGQIASIQSATTSDKDKYLRALEHEARISSDPDAAFAYTMELKKRGEELASVYANVGSQIGGVFNAIIRGGMSAEDVMLKLVGTALSLASSIFLPGAGAVASGIFGFLGSIFGFQDGGVIHAARGMRVPGVGSGDRVPAMLEPGETVVPKGGTHPSFIDEVARAAGGGGGSVTVNLSQGYLVPPDSVTAQRNYQRGLIPVLQDLHSTGRGSVTTNPRFRGRKSR